MKVVIIGAGGAGLAVLHSMLKAGFEVEVLEKNNEIGGIWYTTKYPSLKIHSKSFNYRYVTFPPLVGQDERATREEILDYMKRFAAGGTGHQHIRFNTSVEKILYRENGAARKCEIHATVSTTGERLKIDCDYVVCALGFSNGGMPHTPDFAGAPKFKGTVVHSSDFSQDMLDDVIKNKKKVLVYGAGKSSHEILSVFEDQPQIDIAWIYKKSLWAISYEKMYDNQKMYRFISMFAYYLFLCSLRRKIGKYNWLLYLLERPLIWRGVFLNPLEPGSNIFQNRMAIMGAKQYEYLKLIKSIKAEIVELGENNVKLSNSNTLAADYLICATGYERALNMPKVLVIKDGTDQEYDYTKQHSFYLNMIDPKLPEISLFTSNVVYSQQIFGFSIAAEWLARFFSGTLVHGPSIGDMKAALTQETSSFSAWVSDQYLSKGGPYYFDKDNFVMSGILHELGIDKRLTRQLLMYSTHEKTFNKLCSRISEALEA